MKVNSQANTVCELLSAVCNAREETFLNVFCFVLFFTEAGSGYQKVNGIVPLKLFNF